MNFTNFVDFLDESVLVMRLGPLKLPPPESDSSSGRTAHTGKPRA